MNEKHNEIIDGFVSVLESSIFDFFSIDCYMEEIAKIEDESTRRLIVYAICAGFMDSLNNQVKEKLKI